MVTKLMPGSSSFSHIANVNWPWQPAAWHRWATCAPVKSVSLEEEHAADTAWAMVIAMGEHPEKNSAEGM